ncbi:MAG TPA: asparagine synthase (glutamine-hydrolyzing) [Deltaproteobacteria bacterium]|nr:asparagine synthase (glutamine-hydrolyzing) [Deltaproteobacteria bacterium]HRR22317.1 asparagine synthase (glutamine-hydrolyzing) [Desulfomonilia bacterium]HOE73187.1 asparagine synthase (glutamine-hydrolyzing) [Deltaproteobacteria bacterium]HON62264.1 asparagine synthase (glutamine-hydrolyzing) [Deltaproteobacteria bacterium]HPL87277.1 asparagine synthase (glutamine-hydrolyzing) [Deltaproteobacteria bacterium]
MCGIAGFIEPPGCPEIFSRARMMGDTLVHRGPDDGGVWADESAGIALAHRRLSIIDLSAAGHQPMISASGRYVIVFNGEIYNHLEMREKLQSIAWRGHSDTETLLAAIDAWGIERTLDEIVGMFAFALWDRKNRTLTLARDRMGEKPLYYGTIGPSFVFASELKSLRVFRGFNAVVNRDALALFMRHSYIPAPWSIYEGIFKVPPGTFFSLTSPGDNIRPVSYWSAKCTALAGLADPFRGDEREVVDELEGILKKAVKAQMLADVPLGAFLSGGLDSSLIVALMQAQSSQPVKTFTIGFHEEIYNEADHAQAVARHLGTEHTELYVTPKECRDVIPMLPAIYDEPFSDSSQIPTFLVSELARRHVTVSLSGDGGDELFGGYNRYFRAMKLFRRISLFPDTLRRGMARAVTMMPASHWDRLYAFVRPAMPKRFRQGKNPGSTLHNLARSLGTCTFETLYLSLMSHWHDPDSVVLHGREPNTAMNDPEQWLDCDTHEHRMMYLDQTTYLPDDILVKVDRAAMAVSLETRIPLLDHRVVEFAWRLPLSMKIRSSQSKWALRRILYRYVPKKMLERPKMGFGIPIDLWLRGPLREWAEDLLDEARLRQEGFFRPGPIRAKWHEHLSGQNNWQYPLWDVLMFQAWNADQ